MPRNDKLVHKLFTPFSSGVKRKESDAFMPTTVSPIGEMAARGQAKDERGSKSIHRECARLVAGLSVKPGSDRRRVRMGNGDRRAGRVWCTLSRGELVAERIESTHGGAGAHVERSVRK